jgi:hypothetical protein
MPWKRAKALPPPCNALFEACFRIQREACEAAGRHVPMIVENVRGAQPWDCEAARKWSSKDPRRKRWSAEIARIPLPLSRYIAATFRPQIAEAAE